MDEQQIQDKVQNRLSPKRYNHSLAVMQRCEELAKIYGADVEKARLVGVAHDIAKEMSEEDMIKFASENNIILDEIERNNMGIAHAKIGAEICKIEFGFTKEMVEAVANHTIGKPEMDILSQILFVSDATGLDRKWNDLQYARELSEQSLEEIIIYIIDRDIKENIERKRQIHPNSILLRNQLINNNK